MTTELASSSVPVGWTHRRGRRESLRLTDREMRRHGLVVGRTGSGKTMLIIGWLMWCLVHRPEWRWVLVDPKGELAALVLELVPAIAARSGLTPDDITVVSPWSGRLVPLNLLRLTGLPPDVHAGLVVNLLEAYLGERFGGRGRPMLHALVAAALELRGSLSTCLSILEDDRVATAAAGRIQNPNTRRFLTRVLPREPEASRSSLRSRLRALLQMRALRAMLEAGDCIAANRLIGSRVTSLNFGGAPAGCHEVSLALSSWLLDLTLNACFARPTGSPPLVLIVDEAQSVIRESAGGLEKALQELRWKNVSLISMTQSVEQLRDPSFRSALLANTSNAFILDGSPADLRLIEPALPRPTGRTVAPVGDRLLTEAEELRLLRNRLTVGHGPRTGVFADLSQRTCVPFRSASVPLMRLRERAAQMPASVQAAWQLGRWSMSQADLERSAVRPEDRFELVNAEATGPRLTRPKLRMPE